MIAHLLGRAEPSIPQSPQGARLLARGVDGESACQAIMERAILLPATMRQTSIRGAHSKMELTICPATTRSARGCHLSLRYNPLPMSPVRTLIPLVPQEGFEPPTPSLRMMDGPERLFVRPYPVEDPVAREGLASGLRSGPDRATGRLASRRAKEQRFGVGYLVA
jgi:hypothetical protein